jgi:hypothetical protein
VSDGNGINRTQIWVTVITVVGGLLTAIIVNADKWLPDGEQPGAVAAPAAATPIDAAPSVHTVTTAPVEIGGEWRGEDGSRFGFTQSGASYEYVHTAINGTFQSAGKGTIAGRDLSHTFETITGETGSCTARVDAAGTRIMGSCLFDDGAWTFAIER